MNKLLLLTSIATLVTTQSFSQTNRINHYSHSGNNSTMSIFEANDNMGLNCGTPTNSEYIPDSSNVTFIHDSVFMDTTKPKVCTPKGITPKQNPRRGLCLERKFDIEDAFRKF